MKRAVLHFRKIKTGSDMANIAAHNSMEKLMDESGGWKMPVDQLPEWVKHPDRVNYNRGQMGKQSDSIGRRWAGEVERANLVRKPQQNASRAIEAVFTASAGSFKTAEEWTAYLEDCRQWADQKFGHNNILQWNTHFHEKTPHAHAIIVPIVRGEKNKYSSADFLGGPAGLRIIQDEFAEFNKKYGLARGETGSKKKHTNQSQWKSELIQKENLLQEKITFIDNKVNELKTRELYIEDREVDVSNREEDVRDREIEVAQKENLVYAKEQDLNAIICDKFSHDNTKLFTASIANVMRNERIQGNEITPFWNLFFKRLPDFLIQIVQDIRLSLTQERQERADKQQDRNSSGKSRSL